MNQRQLLEIEALHALFSKNPASILEMTKVADSLRTHGDDELKGIIEIGKILNTPNKKTGVEK